MVLSAILFAERPTPIDDGSLRNDSLLTNIRPFDESRQKKTAITPHAVKAERDMLTDVPLKHPIGRRQDT
jgi:hypothetical protein